MGRTRVLLSLLDGALTANHCFNENRWSATWFRLLSFKVFREMVRYNYDQNLKLADLLNSTEHDTSLSCGYNTSF